MRFPMFTVLWFSELGLLFFFCYSSLFFIQLLISIWSRVNGGIIRKQIPHGALSYY